MADNEKFEEEIKNRMGYNQQAPVCSNCKHFVPTDCSGKAGALKSHCTANTFIVYVSEKGFCKHYGCRDQA